MSLLQLEVLTPEEQQAKVEKDRADDAVRQIVKLALKNRAAGLPEPRPGDRLYVQLQVGIPARSRAGVVFVQNKRTVVEVVDSDASAEDRKPGSGVDACVTPAQAEEILADTALSVGARSSTEVDGAKLRAQLDRVEAENQKLRQQIRDARMNAKDGGDGRPSRLDAARRAREGAQKPGEGEGESAFGGDKT